MNWKVARCLVLAASLALACRTATAEGGATPSVRLRVRTGGGHAEGGRTAARPVESKTGSAASAEPWVVQSVSTNGITLELDGTVKTFKVNRPTKVTVNGVPAGLAEVEPGMAAVVTASLNRTTAAAIRASTAKVSHQAGGKGKAKPQHDGSADAVPQAGGAGKDGG